MRGSTDNLVQSMRLTAFCPPSSAAKAAPRGVDTLCVCVCGRGVKSIHATDISYTVGLSTDVMANYTLSTMISIFMDCIGKLISHHPIHVQREGGGVRT